MMDTASLLLETKDAPEGDDLEVKVAIEKLEKSVDERIKAAVEKINAGQMTPDEIKALKAEIAALKRPGADDREDDEPAEIKAFWAFVRGGTEALEADERKALIVSDDTRGGYLAPEQFEAQLQKELVEISPIRAAARVTPTSAGRITWPKRTGRITARWVGETEERTGTEPTYGQASLEVHEMSAYVDISNWLLEDSAIDLAAELASDFAEEFGRLEAVAFIDGDGVKKPLGLMQESSIAEIANGHAANLSADALIALLYDLPATYRNRGAWMLNGTTLATIRKLKDGQGNYLWQPSFQAGQPETVLGRPVIEAPDMPDVATAARPIVYGDFGQGYRIADRVGLSILRDPYTVATEGLVRFHGRRRVGGATVRPEVFRKLKMTTS